MNKITSILSLTALCMAFVGCDEVEESLSQPSTNPQETIFDASNLQVALNGQLVNLPQASQAGIDAPVATSKVTDFPTASSLQLIMEVSKNADFSNAFQLSTVIDTTGVVSIDPDQFQADYYSKITRDPREATVNVRFIANAVNGSEVVRLGGPDVYYGAGTMQVLPFASKYTIEDSYSLVGNDGAPAVMNHSDRSVYDDPVFSIIVDATAGYEWYVVPATTVDGGASVAYGPEAADALDGSLVEAAVADVTKGVIAEAGPYKVEINMRDLTYKVSLAVEQLYTPGNSNGWNQNNSQVLTTNNYIDYYGFAHLNGQFKFCSQPDWNGINYGANPDQEGSMSTAGDAGNLDSMKDGLFWIHVNLVDLTYQLTEITTLGCIGGFNGWGAQENLTPSADYLTWSGDVTMEAGDEWKFRANDNWDINLGGALDNLVRDGSNLVVDEGGTYTVTLNLNSVPYTASMVKQ